MTLSGDSRLSDPERKEAPYWVRISLFVLIMMVATWLALWAASKGADHRSTRLQLMPPVTSAALPEIAAFGLFVDRERWLV